jgi:hypothetical protein
MREGGVKYPPIQTPIGGEMEIPGYPLSIEEESKKEGKELGVEGRD